MSGRYFIYIINIGISAQTEGSLYYRGIDWKESRVIKADKCLFGDNLKIFVEL